MEPIIEVKDVTKIYKVGMKNNPCLEIAKIEALIDLPIVCNNILVVPFIDNNGNVIQWARKVLTPISINKSKFSILSPCLQKIVTSCSANIKQSEDNIVKATKETIAVKKKPSFTLPYFFAP